MNFLDFALELYPYWLMGVFVIWATIQSGNKDVVRIDWKAISKWIVVLACLALYRFCVFKLFPNAPALKSAAKIVTQIPLAITLMTPWEDAMHCLPLILLQRLIGTKWYTWPIHGLAILILMISFGAGHLYQGIFSAVLLSLYVPYSVRLGKRLGVGTVMVGHVLYDFTTLLTLRMLL